MPMPIEKVAVDKDFFYTRKGVFLYIKKGAFRS